jgi:hypothetical protein
LWERLAKTVIAKAKRKSEREREREREACNVCGFVNLGF